MNKKISLNTLYFISILYLVLIIAVILGLKTGIFGKVIVDKESYESYKNIKEIVELKSEIEKNYYRETKNEDLNLGAIRGLFYALPDGYSRYYTKEELDIRNNKDYGKNILIGIYIERNSNKEFVISSIDKNLTAYEAGIRENDILLYVDDIKLSDDTFQKAIDHIKLADKKFFGLKEYPDVNIKVRRDNKELDFQVKRKEVIEESVIYSDSDGIGYIKIKSFIKGTSNDFEKALKSFNAKGINKIIIDLQDNPGGFVNESVNIAGYLIGKNKVVYYTKHRDDEIIEHKTNKYKIGDFDIVAVVNERTASASELLVSAIKSYNAGKIVGVTTFGKGIIQTTYKLSDGSAFQITTDEYLTPKKENIHKIGIKPDIIEEENRLEKAKELLNNN